MFCCLIILITLISRIQWFMTNSCKQKSWIVRRWKVKEVLEESLKATRTLRVESWPSGLDWQLVLRVLSRRRFQLKDSKQQKKASRIGVNNQILIHDLKIINLQQPVRFLSLKSTV